MTDDIPLPDEPAAGAAPQNSLPSLDYRTSETPDAASSPDETGLASTAPAPGDATEPLPATDPAPPAWWRVPDQLGARDPDGGYIAMRLLSRMQADLDLVTEGKRPASYEEVDKYLGHALVSFGYAPRGLTPEQATGWWKNGGSAMLDVSRDFPRDDGSTPKLTEAAFTPVSAPADETNDRGATGDDQYSDSVAGAVAPSFPGGDIDSTDEADSDAAGERDASEAIDGAPAEQPTDGSSPPAATGASGSSSKALLDEALARGRQVVKTVAEAARTSPTFPNGTDLSTVDHGFGDPAHAFHGDYRTTPNQRAWLLNLKAPAGKDIPYPDGQPGSETMSLEKRRLIRKEVSYFYTLPEVKAFLDLIASKEGADKYGYFLGHGSPPSKLPDLDSFYGGISASGRYQIKAAEWKNYGAALWSRPDFSEITQDLIAITLLRHSGAIGELLKGNLSNALTLASKTFASIPVSLAEDHSYFLTKNFKRDAENKKVTGSNGQVIREQGLQHQPTHFRDLPTDFAQHLKYRQAEFAQAEQDWRTSGTLPKAFISPMKWQSYGLPGFDRQSSTSN